MFRWNHDKKHPNTTSKGRCRYENIECKSIFKASKFNELTNPHVPSEHIDKNLKYHESISNKPQKNLFYKNLRELDIKKSYLICNHYRFTSIDKIIQKCNKNALNNYRDINDNCVDQLKLTDYPEIIDEDLKKKYVRNNTKRFRKLCSCSFHHCYQDCYRQLISKNKDWISGCKLCDTMIYTKNIRKNINRDYNYKLFLNTIHTIMNKYPEFPENCRNIGSYLTNIVQCSNDSQEKIWAQCVNVFIQMEKMHISFSDMTNTNKEFVKERFDNVTIFEAINPEKCDIFQNVLIRDMHGMERFPLVYKLYKIALSNLLKEKKTITYNYYHNTNKNVSNSIDKILS